MSNVTTYFGVDLTTFNPVGVKESFKGSLLKKWLELKAKDYVRAEEAYETYWGPEAQKNKTCPSGASYYFVKESPENSRYILIRDRVKSPDKLVNAVTKEPVTKGEETKEKKKSQAKKTIKNKDEAIPKEDKE